MGVLWGKIGEGVVRYWPLTNSFFLLGVVHTYVPILVKIDQVMRPWECSQTDRYTDWQRQTDFIFCPMLYAIAMGQIIKCQRLYATCQHQSFKLSRPTLISSPHTWYTAKGPSTSPGLMTLTSSQLIRSIIISWSIITVRIITGSRWFK